MTKKLTLGTDYEVRGDVDVLVKIDAALNPRVGDAWLWEYDGESSGSGWVIVGMKDAKHKWGDRPATLAGKGWIEGESEKLGKKLIIMFADPGDEGEEEEDEPVWLEDFYAWLKGPGFEDIDDYYDPIIKYTFVPDFLSGNPEAKYRANKVREKYGLPPI